MSYNSLTAIANNQDWEVSFTNEYDTNQTNLTIITPTAGKELSVRGIYINTEASSGDIRVFFQTSGNTVFKTYAIGAPATGYVPLTITGVRNEPLKITSTLGADQNFFILVNYKER